MDTALGSSGAQTSSPVPSVCSLLGLLLFDPDLIFFNHSGILQVGGFRVAGGLLAKDSMYLAMQTYLGASGSLLG